VPLTREKNLASINGKDVTPVEREFLKNMQKAKNGRKKSLSSNSLVVHEEDLSETDVRPLPHLPPYATQYR
jgi:protein phosphatase 1 regulatory subunit 42